MSGFNSFLGGVTAGQGAKQQRQSAFNASMLSRGKQAIQAQALDQMKTNSQFLQDAGAAYADGDLAGARVKSSMGGHQDLAQVFADLDTEKRQEVKAEMNRRGQIAAALSALPPEQQVIGIQTYGKAFGIDGAELQQAAANPSAALAKFSASMRDIETMIERSAPKVQALDDQGYGKPSYGLPTGEFDIVNFGSREAAGEAQAMGGLQGLVDPLPSHDMPNVADSLDYDALPRGSHYADPNGILRTKR